jgi:hypothetical protein
MPFAVSPARVANSSCVSPAASRSRRSRAPNGASRFGLTYWPPSLSNSLRGRLVAAVPDASIVRRLRRRRYHVARTTRPITSSDGCVKGEEQPAPRVHGRAGGGLDPEQAVGGVLPE